MSLNWFKRKLTLLNVLMIYSVVFNISRGFCFYLAVNKESERTDLRTLAAFFFPPHASSGCSVSLRWSVVIWGHLLYTTRSTGDALPALPSYWPRTSPDSCISMAPQERICPGTAHHFDVSTPAFLAATRSNGLRRVFPNISIRGNTP